MIKPQGSLLTVNEKVMDFSEHVAFVAQKNGMHDSRALSLLARVLAVFYLSMAVMCAI